MPQPSPTNSALAPLRVGLIGFGCVGQGFYDIVQQLPALGIAVSRIVVKSPTKPRSLPAARFEFDADPLLADPNLDVLIEVIDDADEAFRLVSGALRRGRRIVTANKAMLARHLPATTLRSTAEAGVPPDAKEAVLFAVLANETLLGSGLSLGKISLPG